MNPATKGQQLTYNVAIEFLFRVPGGEGMYVKFLYPKDKTAILNRNNCSLLAARYENPSFRFYRGGSEDTLGSSIRSVIVLAGDIYIYIYTVHKHYIEIEYYFSLVDNAVQ
jgi:hypothetical protein